VKMDVLLLILIKFALGDIVWGTCDNWSYKDIENWGNVKCTVPNSCASGLLQCPININSKKVDTTGTLKRLTFEKYNPGLVYLTNNGHNIDGNLTEGSIGMDGSKYQVSGFHFHTSSETHIENKTLALTLHIIHSLNVGNAGNVKVIILSLLFKIGETMPLLSPIFGALPLIQNVSDTTSVQFGGFQQIFDKLTANYEDSYYSYDGSLTSPPCSEPVKWIVFDKDFEISQNDHDMIFKVLGDDVRPIQRNLTSVDFFQSSGTSTGSIVLGITLGVIVVAVFGVFLLLILRWRKNPNKNYSKLLD